MSRLGDLARHRIADAQRHHHSVKEQHRQCVESSQRQALAELPRRVQELLDHLSSHHPHPQLDRVRIKRGRSVGGFEDRRGDEDLLGYCVAYEAGDIVHGFPGWSYYVLSDGRLADSMTSSTLSVKMATNVWSLESVSGPIALIFSDGIRERIGDLS